MQHEYIMTYKTEQDMNNNINEEHAIMNENSDTNSNQMTNDLTPEDLERVNEMIQVAKEIYGEIVTDIGNMEKRDINTFMKKSEIIGSANIWKLPLDHS